MILYPFGDNSIVDIHNTYAQEAKKPFMSATSLKFYSALNPSVVKSTFDDGETYGFKDNVSTFMVADAINNLANRCDKISDELSSSLSSINAFGNAEISRMIVKNGADVGGTVGKQYRLRDYNHHQQVCYSHQENQATFDRSEYLCTD